MLIGKPAGVPKQLTGEVAAIYKEGDDLDKRITAMRGIMQSPIFKEVAPLDQALFNLQFNAMMQYQSILAIRLARANDLANGRLMDTATALGGKPGIIKPNN